MASRKEVYLDYAATTPVNPQVVEAILDCYNHIYGNASSQHYAGRKAKQVLEAARTSIANGLGANTQEVVFTGSGSEADNLAILGVARAYKEKGQHIITTSIEHHAVLETCLFLQQLGYEVTFLSVDDYGRVDPEDLRRSLREDTILVSIMHANNEIGTIQPVSELANIVHECNALFHTDAVQTAGQLPIEVQDLDIDLITLSAHKFYGPKGVGILFVREGVELVPIIHGGSQEKLRRAGTENVPGIVGTAKAFELALQHLDEEATRIRALRDELWARIRSSTPNVRMNGHPLYRLPNNLNVSFKGVEAEGLLLHLSMAGVAASMGSACTSDSIEPSHVIDAIGVPPKWSRGTIRFSLGRLTTMEDVDYTSDVLTQILTKM